MDQDCFHIRGGKPLVGRIAIGGSKNAALALLSAVPLSEGRVVLENVPDIADVRAKVRLLGHFGIAAQWEGSTLILDTSEIAFAQPDELTARQIRTSFFLVGPLLARFGKVHMPAPGGCNIGERPVDYHLKGLRQMGAHIELQSGNYVGEAKRLEGAAIYLDSPSPGATNHLMAAATLAYGNTTIQNAAMEPEVVALAGLLNSMGARIEGAGTATISIQGVQKLTGGSYRVPFDRIQAATFLIAAAATRGDVTVEGVLPNDLVATTAKLAESGAEIHEASDSVRVAIEERPKALRVRTMPHPGFPTDVQQPFAAYLTTAAGTSVIEETIYENRIGHVNELNRMGANIMHHSQTFVIQGVEKLNGATVAATDLRCGAALVVAGLAAEGQTVVRKIHHIDRGYENLVTMLRSLGGDIDRCSETSPEEATAE